MISTSQAKDLIRQSLHVPRISKRLLPEAAGLILAEDVYAPMDSPPFHQAAMDGYAFDFDSVAGKEQVEVMGQVQAGETLTLEAEKGKMVRIFTGAPLPKGTDTVVMQEMVERVGNQATIRLDKWAKGSHVRLAGSQIAKGALAVKKGTRLSPPLIGFLAGLNITEVETYDLPKVAILVTGKELLPAGAAYEPGKIYESNSAMLCAALSEGHLKPTAVYIIDDDLPSIEKAIQEAFFQADVILITGGISVGDFDFVKEALTRNGVEEVFHKVSQKPGKPLFFGKKKEKLVFGLPGNPASTLHCFYHFVVPAIKGMSGFSNPESAFEWKTLLEPFEKKPGLTTFLKGVIEGDSVHISPGQESFRLDAFAQADCYIEIDAEGTRFQVGDKVKVYKINQLWE